MDQREKPTVPTGLRHYPELDGKTFLVCVGAAKCATSWLHRHLDTLPDTVVSPIKELHFFDVKFGAMALGDMQALALSRLAYHLKQEGDPVENLRQRPTFQASLDRAQMIIDDDAYFGHFARLCGPDTRTFCDLTPSYSAIGADGLAYMKAFCASQDIRLKILFIMRDPVARLWSQLRHLQQMNPANDVATKWRDALASPRIIARADYRGIVTALDAAFAPDDLCYLFYETLFETGTLRALCAFAGITYQPAEVARVQNETTVKLPLPPETAAAFRSHLAPQYDFCRARFGKDVPASWQG